MSGLELRLTCPGEHDFRLQVDCTLPGRGVTALCGASGSGKTTLLDCIAGLRRPETGSRLRFRDETWLDSGHCTPPWLRGVGYVFSDARLFTHLDVSGNLRYALDRRHDRRGPALADVVDWLDLGDLLARRPETLSAGQGQRAAIGRALLGAPRLLLLDEPLANLDDAASDECLQRLQALARELDLPMLYVSHDIEEVSQLADHLLLLEGGRVVDQGPLIELCSRLDTRLSRDEGAAAILTAEVAGHDEAYGLTALALEGERLLVSRLPQPPGAARRVRVPARDVSLCRERPEDSSILNILPVTIEAIAASDDASLMLRLALGSQFLLARITRKSADRLALAPGERVFAQIKSTALMLDGNETR
jgi:molybdate transport system ATP-binding protein